MPIKSGVANPVDVSHYSPKLENMILSGKRHIMILRRAHPILFIYSQRIGLWRFTAVQEKKVDTWTVRN